MKIRQGFVSNSSSSSFFIACDPNKTKVKIEIELDFSGYGEEYQTLEDIIDELKDRFCYSGDCKNDVYYQKILDKVKKSFSEGKVVILGDFSNESDDSLSQYFCDAGLPKNAKDFDVIYNEGGF